MCSISSGLLASRILIAPHHIEAHDYEQKYAPDEEYREMSEKSRFWKTYADESTKSDLEMIGNWKEGLDSLLLFVSG